MSVERMFSMNIMFWDLNREIFKITAVVLRCNSTVYMRLFTEAKGINCHWEVLIHKCIHNLI